MREPLEVAGELFNALTPVMLAPDGRIVYAIATITAGQIVRGDRFTVDDRWTYPGVVSALVAWAVWVARDFEGEPEDWIRHQPSNRRRENGDPALETVRP